MRPQPRILIVEDAASIAEFIALNLRHNGYQPLWVPDGERACQELEQDELPDLIVLDWMLPGLSGLELTKRWREDPRTQHIPIILLTARASEDDRVAGLNAAADDYIVKPFAIRELLARIRTILRRVPSAEPDITLRVGDLVLELARHRAYWCDTPLKLGPTEFRLLHYLMQNTERVHSRTQLLEKVWGDHADIEERTVDVHIKRLREALGDGATLVQTVRGVGYRLTVQS